MTPETDEVAALQVKTQKMAVDIAVKVLAGEYIPIADVREMLRKALDYTAKDTFAAIREMYDAGKPPIDGDSISEYIANAILKEHGYWIEPGGAA